MGDATVLAVHDALHRDVVGAGPLEPLLRLDGVTDVLVNGAMQVWVDRGAGLELTGVRFPDDQAVRRLAQRLAALEAADSTTPRPTSTCVSPMAPGSMRCWLRSPGRAP